MPTETNPKNFKYWEPSHGPHIVFFDAGINLVSDIDTVQQRFTVDLTVTLEWMLSLEDIQNYIKAPEDFRPSWEPKLPQFQNLIWNQEPKIEQQNFKIFRQDPSHNDEGAEYAAGVAFDTLVGSKEIRCQGVLSEEFELESFPFDIQDFTVCLRFEADGSEVHGDCDSILFKPNLSKQNFIQIAKSAVPDSQWKVMEPVVQFRPKFFKTLDSNFREETRWHNEVLIHIKGQRNAKAYLLRIALIIFLLGLSSLFSFTIFDEGTSNQLSYGATILLTVLAFQYIITTMLPTLGYLTLLDKYVLFNIVFVALGMFLQAATEIFTFESSKKDLMQKMGMLAGLGFAVINMIFYIYTIWSVIPFEKKKLLTYPNSDNDTKMLTVSNAVQQIMHFDASDSSHYDEHDERQKLRVFFGPASIVEKFKDVKQLINYTGTYFSTDYSTWENDKEVEQMHVGLTYEGGSRKNPGLHITKVTGDEHVAAGKITIKVPVTPKSTKLTGSGSILLALGGGKGANYAPGTFNLVSTEQIVFTLGEDDISFHRNKVTRDFGGPEHNNTRKWTSNISQFLAVVAFILGCAYIIIYIITEKGLENKIGIITLSGCAASAVLSAIFMLCNRFSPCKVFKKPLPNMVKSEKWKQLEPHLEVINDDP